MLGAPLDYLFAFLVGGLVCLLAQLLIDLTKMTDAWFGAGSAVAAYCFILADGDEGTRVTVYAEPGKTEALSLDGVTLMEVDETGDRRWVLEGSSAKQSEGVKIRFFDVIVTLFRKDGSVVKLLTEYADVNRETGEIETDKTVQLLDGDRIIKGRGLYVIYSKEKKECKLFHDVEIKAKIEKKNIDVFKAGK